MRQAITASVAGLAVGIALFVAAGWVWLIWGADPAKDPLFSFRWR